jgi:hypothetical protein
MAKVSVPLCAIAGIAILLISLIPQVHLCFVRGEHWNGAYAAVQGDELLYSAYINALLAGRDRRNDPFGGRDNIAASPIPESSYSIQIVPAFALTSFARLTGTTAATAFIVLTGTTALLASMALFWVILCVTGNNVAALTGTLFVLCFGAAAGRQGLLGLLFSEDVLAVGLPFLRRYAPAAAFPLLFVFFSFVWHAFRNPRRGTYIYALLAGLTLAILMFSYFYLWTACAAWVLCLGFLWLVLRPGDRRNSLLVLTVVAALVAAASIPYGYLLGKRAVDHDQQQVLLSTHQPDFFRVPEIIGVLVLLMLIVAVRRRKTVWSARGTVYAASFALLPLVVFNQQILTGKTMQPYHYEAFIINYAVLLGVVLAVAVQWKSPGRTAKWIAVLSLFWGVLEVSIPAAANSTPKGIVHDEMIPVFLRLNALTTQDGTLDGLRTQGWAPTVVFSADMAVNQWLPTWTSQPTLLDVGGVYFGVSSAERKQFLYAQLYYSNIDAEELKEILNDRSADRALNYYARSALFGPDRILPALTFDFVPLRSQDIETAVRAYAAFADAFSPEQMLQYRLRYLIKPADREEDLSRIDLWYKREPPERVGRYELYRLRIRE